MKQKLLILFAVAFLASCQTTDYNSLAELLNDCSGHARVVGIEYNKDALQGPRHILYISDSTGTVRASYGGKTGYKLGDTIIVK